jgi:hypothetical protein
MSSSKESKPCFNVMAGPMLRKSALPDVSIENGLTGKDIHGHQPSQAILC